MIQVVSLGGSAVFGRRKNIGFLKGFSGIVKRSSDEFHIVMGGGETAREYQGIGRSLGLGKKGLDEIGIAATKLNAEVLSQVLGAGRVITSPLEPGKQRVNVYSGWKPGSSTDYVCVVLAKKLGAGRIVNITRISYLYTKDPAKKGAKRIMKASKKDIIRKFGGKWEPGLKFPIGPRALSDSKGIEIHTVGRAIENLRKCLEGREFRGTIIHD